MFHTTSLCALQSYLSSTAVRLQPSTSLTTAYSPAFCHVWVRDATRRHSSVQPSYAFKYHSKRHPGKVAPGGRGTLKKAKLVLSRRTRKAASQPAHAIVLNARSTDIETSLQHLGYLDGTYSMSPSFCARHAARKYDYDHPFCSLCSSPIQMGVLKTLTIETHNIAGRSLVP